MALGGIGSGFFVAYTDGTFREWCIANNIPLGTGPEFRLHEASMLFFQIKISQSGKPVRILLLQVEDELNAAAIKDHQYHYMYPWMKGADYVSCDACVPFVTFQYRWDDEPIEVTLSAWSPLIPNNVKDSSLPAAFFELTWRWLSKEHAEITALCVARNPVGYATKEKITTVQRLRSENLSGYQAGAQMMSQVASDYGTQAVLAANSSATCYLGWEHLHPYYERLLREQGLPEFDDTSARIITDNHTGRKRSMERVFNTAGVAHHTAETPEQTVRFVYSWHFPNLKAQDITAPSEIAPGYLEVLSNDTADSVQRPEQSTHIEGHYYTNFFSSASEVATYCMHQWQRLKCASEKFLHDQQLLTQIPHIAHLANAQLNTLRTSSWLTKSGDFGILEGINPWKSFAGLATTDVAAYGQIAVTMLYPELDRATWSAHRRLQKDNGIVAHSITKNFRTTRNSELSGKRLDMPGQFAALSLRAALLHGEINHLREAAGAAQKALEYVLRQRDQNGDGLPDMEGIMCSFDNFPMYGLSPFVAGQFLAGVAALVKALETLGEYSNAQQWRELLSRGRDTLDRECFNGRYYILCSGDHTHPRDEGCLIDQCLGQLLALQCGAEPVFSPEHCRIALQHIFKLNYRPEQGVRNCTWPGDGWLHPVADDCWVDQANTVWTGSEFAYAALCLWNDLPDIAKEVLNNIEKRHRRWGIVFNHQEFGGHYFRPLSAWSVIHALKCGHLPM